MSKPRCQSLPAVDKSKSPRRIPRVLKSVQKVWEANPELSLCELITRLLQLPSWTNSSNLTDQELMEKLPAYYKNRNPSR